MVLEILIYYSLPREVSKHMKFTHSIHQFITCEVSRQIRLKIWAVARAEVVSRGAGGRGGRWARGYTSKWRVESRDEIIGLYWLLCGWFTVKTTQKKNWPTVWVRASIHYWFLWSQVLHKAKYHHSSLSQSPEKTTTETSFG